MAPVFILLRSMLQWNMHMYTDVIDYILLVQSPSDYEKQKSQHLTPSVSRPAGSVLLEL